MVRNSTERLGGDCNLGSKGSAFFLHSSSRRQHINSTSIYKCSTVLVLGGGVSCMIFSSIVHLLSGFVFFLADCAFFRTYGQIK